MCSHLQGDLYTARPLQAKQFKWGVEQRRRQQILLEKQKSARRDLTDHARELAETLDDSVRRRAAEPLPVRVARPSVRASRSRVRTQRMRAQRSRREWTQTRCGSKLIGPPDGEPPCGSGLHSCAAYRAPTLRHATLSGFKSS